MKLSAPPHTLRFPAPASSPLCSAVLGPRSSCCLRGRGPRGSGSEPGVLSPVAPQFWAPECVLGGFWGGLPLLLVTPPWADPSMGTLTWTLHWASQAGGWGSDPSLEEVDGMSPSSATSGGKLCNDSNRQPGLLGVFRAGPGQYGCCFCPLEFLLLAETCVCSDSHPGGRRHLLGHKVNLGSQRCLDSPHPAQPALPWGGDATGPQASDRTSVWASLRQTRPENPASPFRGKGLRVARVGWERWLGPAWGSRVTFLFLRAKGQRRPRGALSQRPQRSHTLCL